MKTQKEIEGNIAGSLWKLMELDENKEKNSSVFTQSTWENYIKTRTYILGWIWALRANSLGKNDSQEFKMGYKNAQNWVNEK
jgi:hypothetical protein